MTTLEIHFRLATLISEKVDRSLAPAQVTMDSRLHDDLGIDSLAASELLFEIEEEFGTEVGEVDANQLRTVRDIVNAIEARSAA